MSAIFVIYIVAFRFWRLWARAGAAKMIPKLSWIDERGAARMKVFFSALSLDFVIDKVSLAIVSVKPQL